MRHLVKLGITLSVLLLAGPVFAEPQETQHHRSFGRDLQRQPAHNRQGQLPNDVSTLHPDRIPHHPRKQTEGEKREQFLTETGQNGNTSNPDKPPHPPKQTEEEKREQFLTDTGQNGNTFNPDKPPRPARPGKEKLKNHPDLVKHGMPETHKSDDDDK